MLDALNMRFIEDLWDELKFQVKGVGCIDFMNAVAKAENYEKIEKFNQRRRMISTTHHLHNHATINPWNLLGINPQDSNLKYRWGPSPNSNSGDGYGNQNDNKNMNQKRRQSIHWQQDPEFIKRARRLGLYFLSHMSVQIRISTNKSKQGISKWRQW